MNEGLPVTADTASASCSTLVTEADNTNVITSSYKLRKRNVTDHVQKSSSSSTPSKSKRFLWYEQKPFDDPVKEAKRMRSLNGLTLAWDYGMKVMTNDEPKCASWLDGVEMMENQLRYLNDETVNRSPWAERIDEGTVRKGLP